jgi:hypothetical protein
MAVDSLRRNEEAQESDLHIFSDGPKDDADDKKVREVRKYIRTVSGFRQVTIIEKEKNCGLANSIISGVTDLCERVGSVIVLEDDLVVSRFFLEYMNKALELYRSHEQVMQVSGYMYPLDLQADTDAVFMPFTTSWGWATWKRAWDRFDPLMQGYESVRRDRKLRKKFDLDNSFDCYPMLEAQKKGAIDSWAIRWYLSVFLLGGLTLHPAKSLVKNMGFDNSGVHSKDRDKVFATELDDFTVMKYPSLPETSGPSYTACKTYLKKIRRPFVARVKGLFLGSTKISI